MLGWPQGCIETDLGRSVSYLSPTSLGELVTLRAEKPDWLIVAGGTDVMVPINFGRLRPEGIIDVSRVKELLDHSLESGMLRIGAGVSFSRIQSQLSNVVPGFAIAARGVASPQIRAVATIGGNLGTGSPAGDAHPFLIAADTTVEMVSIRGTRTVPVSDFFLSPGKTVLEDDEVISTISMPVSNRMSQQFSKIGARNAMVISIASVGLVIDWERARVGIGLGSVGPTPIRAVDAEYYLESLLWSDDSLEGGHSALDKLTSEQIAEFVELVQQAATPIDDLRGPASYRRHTVGVMARRCLAWCLDERQAV